MKKATLSLFLSVLSISTLMCGCSATPAPVVTEAEKTRAIDQILLHDGAEDAALKQKGNTLSLVVVVSHGTSADRAKEIGEDFVRLVKSFSKDVSPEREVGQGVYDYLIGVYYPGQIEIATGAKASIATSIRW